MKRALISVAVLVTLQGAMVGVWFMVERSRKPDHKTEPLRNTGGVQTIKMNRLAPDFRYQLPNGAIRRFSSLKGRPVIVHLWATWCPPCRKELPALLAFAKKHKVSLLAVSVDDSWKQIRSFLGPGAKEPIVLAQASTAMTKSYAVKVFPVTYVVDRRGYLALRFDGARNWRDGFFLKSVMAGMK
tara:strand:+ start:1864 stop:2418 length:555 start_codon:yes stop_codon:yes gene_type:complete